MHLKFDIHCIAHYTIVHIGKLLFSASSACVHFCCCCCCGCWLSSQVSDSLTNTLVQCFVSLSVYLFVSLLLLSAASTSLSRFRSLARLQYMNVNILGICMRSSLCIYRWPWTWIVKKIHTHTQLLQLNRWIHFAFVTIKSETITELYRSLSHSCIRVINMNYCKWLLISSRG